MKNQYRKFVYLDENGRSFEFHAKKDVVLEATEEPDGKLIIRAIAISKQNYVNPPVPEGWKHISGEWNNGFIIRRDSDGSEMVWVPVESLDADGTLDGVTFNEKFGRRFYNETDILKGRFSEKYEGKIVLQKESIKKYGGFYISRYEISMSINKSVHSLKNQMPMINVDFFEAMRLAKSFEESDKVKSHLIFGAEYDSVLAWFIKSRARKIDEITVNSARWGNFADPENSLKGLAKTGSNETWCTNGIYDFAGNLDEWTQEKNGETCRVTRSGNYNLIGYLYPASYRNYRDARQGYQFTGFRIALYIK